MKLFSFLKKKKKDDGKDLTSKRNTLVTKKNMLSKVDFRIHDDIEDLIWFKNGPKKNYDPKQDIEINEFYVGDIRYTFEISFSGSIEPSCIDTELLIEEFRDMSDVEKLPYYPSYSDITPKQRVAYLKFLSNPYNTSFEVGYAFILYYGLERFLLTDKFERAFEIILKLRDTHDNQSFQFYSGNALILSCIYNKRPDMMIKFLKSVDKEFELKFSDNLFLLSAYSFEIPLYSNDIIRLAKTFEFNNKNYISKYPEMFNNTMIEIIEKKYEKDFILLGDILSKTEFNKIRTEKMRMFANISISDKEVDVPLISESFKVKKVFNNILEETHETVKFKLAELRKKGKAPNPIGKSKSKTKPILVFDEQNEKILLKELKDNMNSPVDRHFSYIQLQNFYYRFRDLDDKYVEECIKYCEKDIEILDELQKAYISRELENLEGLTSIYEKKELEKRKQEIEKGFNGNIPAFKRLAIIYEKNKQYNKAVEICDMAINYYSNWSMDKSEFENRKNKLLNKMEKDK